MSVLENLFTDIADAIRDKTGETDTIRPIDFPEKIAGIKENSVELLENVLIQPDFSNGDQSFSAPDEMAVKSAIIQKPETLIPENIAEGVNIAGIVGTLVVGGGNVKVAVGTVKPDFDTGQKVTVNHGLGVIPDVICIRLMTNPGGDTTYVREAFVINNRLISPSTSYYLAKRFVGDSIGAKDQRVASLDITSGANTSYINSVTAETFTTPATMQQLVEYVWIAIGGLA